MVRDERKVLLLGYTDDSGLKPKMRIFTSAGKLISSFTVYLIVSITVSGCTRVLWVCPGMRRNNWFACSSNVCLNEPNSDGTVHIFSVHGEKLRTLSLGQVYWFCSRFRRAKRMV